MSYSSESSVPTSRPSRLDINSAKRQQSIDEQKTWSSTHTKTISSLSPNLQPSTPPILVANPNPNSSVCLPSMFADKYLLVEQIETSNLFRCVDTQTSAEFCCKVCIRFIRLDANCVHCLNDSTSPINRLLIQKAITSSSPDTFEWTGTQPSIE